MTDKPDGGPAYPVSAAAWPRRGGMSLRDYFAAASLQGIISNADVLDELARQFFWDEKALVSCITERSYSIADAMIAERDIDRAEAEYKAALEQAQ